MKFLKKHKGKITALLVVVTVLVFSYGFGEDTHQKKEQSKNEETVQLELAKTSQIKEKKIEELPTVPEKDDIQKEEKTDPEKEPVAEIKKEKPATENEPPVEIKEENPKTKEVHKEEEKSQSIVIQGKKTDKETGTIEYETEPVPEGRPLPIEPQTVTISDKEMQCTLSIRCDTLLSNLDKLEKAKWELVPKDGIILAEKTVTFYEGESVFNVLLRETRRNGVHMEYVNTPIYNSAYIEGIHNLYEFDCGELSGWMYSVNGWFPNYGCSRYALREGDRIEWVYTCELGKDIK